MTQTRNRVDRCHAPPRGAEPARWALAGERIGFAALTCLAVAWSPARAQEAPPLAKGDVIRLDVEFPLTSSVAGQDGAEVCFRRGTKFEVVTATAQETLLRRKSRWTFGEEGNESLARPCGSEKASLGDPANDRALYRVGPEGIPKDYYRHSGITHGALFVPFKRRSDHTLSGESNLGYYLGYRFGGPMGVTITPAFSAGMSLVNVSDDTATNANSTRDSGTRAAFTWTVGFILNHLDAFQIGVFVGKDRLGGDVGAAWKYEGKYWTSVAFGYAFNGK